MGRRATRYEKAAMESLFHTLKVELVHRERYTSRRSTTAKICEYTEVYYNRQAFCDGTSDPHDVRTETSLTACPGKTAKHQDSRRNDAKAVPDRAGHSSITVTMDVYGTFSSRCQRMKSKHSMLESSARDARHVNDSYQILTDAF
jgi:hypothetical protein